MGFKEPCYRNISLTDSFGLASKLPILVSKAAVGYETWLSHIRCNGVKPLAAAVIVAMTIVLMRRGLLALAM